MKNKIYSFLWNGNDPLGYDNTKIYVKRELEFSNQLIPMNHYSIVRSYDSPIWELVGGFRVLGIRKLLVV